MNLSVPEYILSLKPYSPGKPIEELKREYGIKEPVKLASNENPLGPSPMALAALQKALENLNRYPDGSGYYLIKRLSEKFGVNPGNIVLGNGSDEIIGMLTRSLLKPGDEAIMTRPSFLMYDLLVRSVDATSVHVPLKSFSIDLDGIAKQITPKTRMIFITNPNNPTGTVISAKNFESFVKNIPADIILVLDEAYIEFVRDRNCLNGFDYLNTGRPVVTLRTFSKAYGLAGLRIGYGLMPKEIAELLNRVRQPFNTNTLAQAGALAAIEDEDFLRKTLKVVHKGLSFLYSSLDNMGIEYFPTEANFFLINIKKDADEVYEDLLKHGIIVRSMTSYGYPDYIRVNVGLYDENVRFIDALEKVI